MYNGWCLIDQGVCNRVKRETGERPVRSRHCDVESAISSKHWSLG